MKLKFIVAIGALILIGGCSGGGSSKEGKAYKGLKANLVFDGAKADHSQTAALIFQLTNVSNEPILLPGYVEGLVSTDFGLSLHKVMGNASQGKLVMSFPLRSIDGTVYELAPGQIAEVLHEVSLSPSQKVYMTLCMDSDNLRFMPDYNGWTGENENGGNECVESNILSLEDLK